MSPFCGKGNGEDPGPPSWLRMRLRGADNDAHNHHGLQSINMGGFRGVPRRPLFARIFFF